MKKTAFIILVLMLNILAGAKTAALPNLARPVVITVDEKNLFVSEGYDYSIRVFSLENFELIRKFGKKGEGPGEFRNIPLIFLKGEEIHVTPPVTYKYYRFSKKGKLLEEKNFGFMGVIRMSALGENYAVSHRFFSTSEVCLLNNRFEKVKTFYLQENPSSAHGKPIRLVKPKISMRASDNRLYIANANKGLYIEVYDSAGNMLKKIIREYEKIKIDKLRREKIKDEFMNISLVKKGMDYFKKKRYTFPEFFPAMEDILVSEGKIYVRTYKLRDNKNEYLILDQKGKLLKKVFLPDAKQNLYIIANGTFYCLIENVELEQWEIHSIAL